MVGARQVQEVTGIQKYYKFRSLYIIQDIKTGFSYVIITNQAVMYQVIGNK